MWSQLELFHHAENGSNGNGANGSSPSFEEFSFFCVGPIKAGWLVVERNHWTLSITGRNAYKTYNDPHQLMTEAAKQSMQGWLATRFPWTYYAAGKTKDQVTLGTSNHPPSWVFLVFSKKPLEKQSPGRKFFRFSLRAQSL